MSTGNPLTALVPALAAPRPTPSRQTGLRWAWVASLAPLRIRWASEPDPVDVDVTLLVPPSTLQVGHQVLVLQHAGELVLLGRAYHPDA